MPCQQCDCRGCTNTLFVCATYCITRASTGNGLRLKLAKFIVVPSNAPGTSSYKDMLAFAVCKSNRFISALLTSSLFVDCINLIFDGAANTIIEPWRKRDALVVALDGHLTIIASMKIWAKFSRSQRNCTNLKYPEGSMRF